MDMECLKILLDLNNLIKNDQSIVNDIDVLGLDFVLDSIYATDEIIFDDELDRFLDIDTRKLASKCQDEEMKERVAIIKFEKQAKAKLAMPHVSRDEEIFNRAKRKLCKIYAREKDLIGMLQKDGLLKTNNYLMQKYAPKNQA